MNDETSLYLDIVRFLAAMAVFVGHVSGQRLTGGLFWQVAPYGPEAVAVFFVLSGFVIGYVTDTREASAADYAVARAARIASVALPALFLTFSLDAIGSATRPDLYTADWGYQSGGQIVQFLTGALFVNHLWFLDIVPGSDLAYWSLGYEVPYYIIFGIAFFAPLRWRVAGVLIALIIAGPSIAALFPLWLIGVAAYRICSRRPLGVVAGALLWLGAAAAWIAYETWAWHGHRLDDLAASGLVLPDILQDYLVGGLFALHVIGLRGVSPWLRPVFARIARPVRWVAGATFSLYLYHLPVAQFIATQMPWPPTAPFSRLAIIGGTLLVVFALAEITERRKVLWRRGITRLVRGTVSRAAT